MTPRSELSIPPSLAPDGDLISQFARLLVQVEELAPDATGVLSFGVGGIVLVESRHVCWAAAPGMRERLSRLLRQQRSPPLSREFVDRVLRECHEDGVPLGEAFLRTGQVSEDGLRAAIFSHTVEALAHIAESGRPQAGFIPHSAQHYGARFSFSTAELLAAVGARSDRLRAAAARRALQETMLPDTRGVAFAREGSGPVVIAVHGQRLPRVPQLVDVCHWSAGLFDVSGVISDGIQIATSSSHDGHAVVTWLHGGTHYVALCANRAASALLTSRLGESLAQGTEVHP